jgi:DNA-binding transcriptional regulator YhcF (GntR family)
MDILENIRLNPTLDTPLAVQLKEQLTWLIASGQIQPGESLPSVRLAARRLGINLHTVRSAYHKIEAERLVQVQQGKATRVLPFSTGNLAQITNTSPSHTVGVIIPSITNPFYHPFLQGVEAIAKKKLHNDIHVCDP